MKKQHSSFCGDYAMIMLKRIKNSVILLAMILVVAFSLPPLGQTEEASDQNTTQAIDTDQDSVNPSIKLTDEGIIQEAPAEGLPRQAEKRNMNNQTYKEWLERYQAWDKLDTVYARNQGESPEIVLKRVSNLLTAGKPDKALELIESTPPFNEAPSLEAERLWLGGRAMRAMGVPNQAVLWFSQAGKLLPTSEFKLKFNQEQGLNLIWRDVFRNLYWTYVSTFSLSREAQAEFLQLIIHQALSMAPADPFWRKAAIVFNQIQDGAVAAPKTQPLYFVSKNDRKRIVQALAALSFQSSGVHNALEQIQDSAVRFFWSDACVAIQELSVKNHAEYFDQANFIKVSSFLKQEPFKHLLKDRSQWFFTTEDRRLRVFAGNILVLPAENAHRLFEENDVDKLMPDADPLEGTDMLRMAVAMMAGDVTAAQKAWDSVDPRTLPLGLRLAGMILFQLDISQVTGFGDTEVLSNQLLATLASAAGNPPALPHEAPFWLKVSSAEATPTLISKWPLDRELLFAAWREQWLAQPTSELSRRVAYLFPDKQFGMMCALFLADKAVDDKQLALAAYYLGNVPQDDTNSTLQAEYLTVRAEYEVANSQMAEAFATYQELVATGVPISDITRLKIAFLMQQMGDLQGGREHLLTLWAKKTQFDTAMQAEILFYLAEGEAAMANKDQALDYYLQLAWQYPQESMWALTAMYRAASIYEERKEYEPAVRLLSTVINNADTPKQKEAATSRLESIKGKMSKPNGNGPGSVPYPF